MVAAGSLGQTSISLGLNLAPFQRGLTTATTLLYRTSTLVTSQLVSLASTSFNSIVQAATSAGSSITSTFSRIFAAIPQQVSTLAALIGQKFSSVLQFVNQQLGQIPALLGSIQQFAINAAASVNLSIRSGIVQAQGTIVQMQGIFTSVFSNIKTTIANSISSTSQSFNSIVSSVQSIGGSFARIFAAVPQQVSTLTALIGRQFSGVLQFISQQLGQIPVLLGGIQRSAINAAASVILSIRSGIVQAQGMIFQMQGILTSVFSNIKSTISNSISSISQSFNSIVSNVQSIGASIASNIAPTINAVRSQIAQWGKQVDYFIIQLTHGNSQIAIFYQQVALAAQKLALWVSNGASAQNALRAIAPIIQGWVADVRMFSQSLSIAFQGAIASAQILGSNISSQIGSVISSIKVIAGSVVQDISRQVSLITSQIQLIASGPMAAVTGVFREVGRHIVEYAQEIGFLKFQLEASTGAASSLYQKIASVGSALNQWVANGMSARNAFAAISSLMQAMTSKVSTGIQDWVFNIRLATSSLTGTDKIIGVIKSGFQQIVSATGKGLAAPIEGFNAVLGDVMQKLGPFSKILASRDLATGMLAAGAAAQFFVKTVFSLNLSPLENRILSIFKVTNKFFKESNPIKAVVDTGVAVQDLKGAVVGVVAQFKQVVAINNQLKRIIDGLVGQIQFIHNAGGAFAGAMGPQGPTLTTMWNPEEGVLLASQFEQVSLSIEGLSKAGGATKSQITDLFKEIKRLGSVTSLAPVQVAELSSSLIKMGISAEDTTDALEGIVRTAEATKTPVEDMGNIIGATLAQFQLEAKDATRVGDVLAKVAANSATNVTQLAEALRFVGTRAKASGQSLEETVAMIGLLQTSGLQGSIAGTSSSNLFAQLQSTAGSKEGKNLLAQLGLSDKDILDQTGKMDILDVIPKLKTGIEELKKTVEGARQVPVILNQIFGQEAGMAINAMLSQSEEAITKLVSAAKTAEGFSMGASENQLRGASGATKILEGQIAAFAQTVGDVYMPVLELAIRKMSLLMSSFLNMPEVIQKVVIGFFALSPVLMLHIKLIKLSTYADKVWSSAKKAHAFLLSGEALNLDKLNTALKGNLIWQKATVAWNAISTRAIKMLRGEYGLLTLQQELWAKRSVAWKVAHSWFDSKFGSTIAAIKTMIVQLGLLIGVMWAFQGLTERSAGGQLASDMNKAGKAIHEIINPTEEAKGKLGDLFEVMSRFKDLGLVEGARENLARLAQSFGSNTDADSDYGNQGNWGRGGGSIMTGRQLGNQRSQLALGNLTDQVSPLFQESLNLRGSKDTSSQYLERVKELRKQLEEVLKILKTLKVDENTATGEQHKILVGQIEAEIKAHEARIYAIENGIDVNRDMVKSLEEVTQGYQNSIKGIEQQSLKIQNIYSDRLYKAMDRGEGGFTPEDYKIAVDVNEINTIRDKINETKKALFELDIARVEKTDETLGDIVEKEKELQGVLLQLEIDLNNKRLQLSKARIDNIQNEHQKKLSDVEWYEQRAIAITKYALAKGQITRKEYDKYMYDHSKVKLEERKKIIEEELKALEDMFKSGKLAAQQYSDRRQDLTHELHKVVEQMSDFEIKRQKDVAKAYEEKLSVISEEISLKQSLDELALVDAEAAGASELELGEMKLEQLKQMQEMKRQELELQLAKNLASAEDVELQQQLNDLILKRFESDSSKELKQAQFQVQETQKPEGSQRIQDSANAKSEMIGIEAEYLGIINELRSQEIELIDRAKESLQLKHDAIAAEEEAVISSLERQKSLADELLQLQKETGEEAALMREELEAQLGLGTYTDYFGQTYKKKGDASEVEILERKYEIEKQIAEAKEAQLVRQHELQSQLLDMEAQQNLLNAEQAIQEAEINELKASQAIIEAQAALEMLKLEQGIAESQAKQTESAKGTASAYRGRASAAREANQEAKAQSEEDKLQMQLAEGKLGIAQQQMELARSQTEQAREQKKILEDQSVVREKILDIQQDTEKSELEAANAAADRAGRLAIATAEAKSNSEGMADAMGRAADSAGQAADAMGKAADAAGSAANAVKDMSGGSGNQGKGLVASSSSKNTNIYKDGAGEPFAKLGASGSSSFARTYANVDLADIAKRELELAAKIAEASGDTAKAQAIRDQIASENKKMELKALQDEANYLREQRALYHSERQRFIDQTIAVSKSLQRASGVPTLRNFAQEAETQAQKIFGGSGGIGVSGGKSMQLLGQALQGFNPQIQQQQIAAQQQMGKAIDSGNKEVGGKLDKINDTIGKAMSRPTEVNISGSEDIGGDVSKTLKALQIAQR